MGTPFANQFMLGLGLPLALQIKLLPSPGDNTRLVGSFIQYGAAERKRENVDYTGLCKG